MEHTITEARMMDLLELAIERAGSATKFAAEAGLSPTCVSLARNRKMPVPPRLLAALGLERVETTYRIVDR